MSHPSEGFYSPKVEQFLKHARATAMILMRDETIIAKQGQLSAAGFRQFAQAVQCHCPGCDQGGLNPYVVLALDDRVQSLFTRCTPNGDCLLGLAFPMDIPLKRMRRDLESFMRLITTVDQIADNRDERLEQSLQLTEQPTSKPDPPSIDKVVPKGWQIENEMAGQLEDDIMPDEPLAQPGAPKSKNVKKEKDSQTDWQPLDALLPSEGMQAVGDLEVDQGIDHRVDHLTAQLGGPTIPPDDDLVSILKDDDERHLDLHTLDDRESRSTPVTYHEQTFSEDTHPASCIEDDISLAETVMDTTFYLVPRLNDHYLLGELALQLREWFPGLCEIYGWELASLSVRPDYLQWTLLDFPECLMRDMLAVVRHWTSERIFKAFPVLQAGNPTQDFWSPGYLVDTQNREFPTQVLITHVSRNRLKQESPVG